MQVSVTARWTMNCFTALAEKVSYCLYIMLAVLIVYMYHANDQNYSANKWNFEVAEFKNYS